MIEMLQIRQRKLFNSVKNTGWDSIYEEYLNTVAKLKSILTEKSPVEQIDIHLFQIYRDTYKQEFGVYPSKNTYLDAYMYMNTRKCSIH